MTNIELSYEQIIIIESSLYRFVKDNNSYMSKELRNKCLELAEIFRKLEGVPPNLE